MTFFSKLNESYIFINWQVYLSALIVTLFYALA